MNKKIIKIFEKIADGITNFILSIGNLLTLIISPILTFLAWVGFVILALYLLRALVRFLIG